MNIPEHGRTNDLTLAVLLIGVAGFVDAIGFLELKHLFASYMSGNSTQLAVAAAQAAWGDARSAGGVVTLFVAGVMTGRLLGMAAGNWRRCAILSVEAVLLGAAALASFNVTIVLIVFAMGMQNAVLRRAGDVKVSLTYVTGTLVTFAEKLADALVGAVRPFAWTSEALLWIGLVIGAAAGATVFGDYGAKALFAPAAVAAALAFVSGLAERRRLQTAREDAARQFQSD
jgi:uncharacterized membrane protein YoaK (UPF0700 family)